MDLCTQVTLIKIYLSIYYAGQQRYAIMYHRGGNIRLLEGGGSWRFYLAIFFISLETFRSKGRYPQTVSHVRFGLVRRSCVKVGNHALCVFMDRTNFSRRWTVVRVSHDGIHICNIPADDWTVARRKCLVKLGANYKIWFCDFGVSPCRRRTLSRSLPDERPSSHTSSCQARNRKSPHKDGRR